MIGEKIMVIRKAISSDVDKIYSLLEGVLRLHANGRPDIFNQSGSKYNHSQILEIIACENTPVFVADDGGVIGYVFCEILDQQSGALKSIKTLYIDDLCVDEKAQKKGVGRALYEKALAFAKEKGCYNLTLNVWAFNENAIKFYEKLGLTTLKTTLEQIVD